MGRYLDPTNDFAFKKLFGKEDHKPLLISFLNSILNLKGKRKICGIEHLPQEEVKISPEIKGGILDVKCTDEAGHQYIVEMQNRKIDGFLKRCQYYTSISYVNQAKKGKGHYELKPVILLAVLNHKLFEKDSDPVSFHRTLNIKTLENHLKDISYVFIELPKFKKSASQAKSLQDKWLYFFKNWEVSKDIPKNVKEEELIEAYNSMEEFNWSQPEVEAYIKANIAKSEANHIKEKVFKEGHEEGLKKGLKEGLKKGRDEGLKEAQISTAKNLLKMGIPVSKVVKATGLTKREIEALKKKRKLKRD